jgi:hypothetical protein
MPAAVGGCAAGAVPAGLRARSGLMPESVRPSRRHRLILQLSLLIVSGLLALLTAPLAQAEEVFTGQAAAANATDSAWIPAPGQKAAVCIIDTGNDVLPDTANVVARFAVNAGVTTGDMNPGKHGTLMSMIASAPYDGVGMVGAAPSINVVSINASTNGTGFGGNDLNTAIQTCVSYRNIYNIKVISMSLGGDYNPAYGNPGQVADTKDFIDNARYYGINVVAAAGNSAQGTADWPAGYAPTFAVGAADNSGVRCSFASWGPDVDLWAPGCPVDVARPDSSATPAWISGSSEATAFVAGILTQLRGLDPALTPDGAQALLKNNAKALLAGPYLDVAAAFSADGLAAQLAAGHAAIPTAATTQSATATTTSAPVTGGAPAADRGSSPTPTSPAVLVSKPAGAVARARLSKPVVRSLTFRRGVLTIVFKAKAKKTEARVRVYARKAGRAFPTLTRSLHVTSDRLRTRVSGTLSEVSITYRDPSGVRRDSAPLSLHPRK